MTLQVALVLGDGEGALDAIAMGGRELAPGAGGRAMIAGPTGGFGTMR